MNSLNKIMLEGNLTRDPESRDTPKGNRVCQFSVASNRYSRSRDGEGQQEVSFFDVEAWGAIAERCAGELTKGRGVRITGRLKQDRWIDKDGNNRNKIKIVAETVEIRAQFQKKFQPPTMEERDLEAV